MNRREIVVYISGKYSGLDFTEENINILKARKTAIEVWDKGFTCICPHTNTINFGVDSNCSWDDYLAGDIELINRCDVLLMLDGWAQSKGARIECDWAMIKNKPIFYSIKELEEYYAKF